MSPADAPLSPPRSAPSSQGRLTRRFALALIGIVLVVFGVGAAVGYQRERAQFERALRLESLVLGGALARGMADVWAQNGERAAFRFLGESSDERSHISVRWVWVDEAPGKPHTPAVDITELRDRVLMRRHDAVEVVYTYVPVRVPGPRRGALELRQSLAEPNAYLRESLRNNIIEAVALAAVGAGFIFALGVIFVSRPVARVVEKARRVGSGDLTGPLILAQRDELGELAVEMNRMCDRLVEEGQARAQMQSQLRLAERLTTVGKLASGLAHELGTPLNVVAGRARLIANGEVENASARASGQIIVDQAERMTKLIRQLLDFARPRPPHKTLQALAPIAERAVALLAPMAKKANVELQVLAAHAIELSVDESQLQQVITNLIVNALHATPSGGHIDISVEQVQVAAPADVGGGTRLCGALTVRDSGHGMDDATRARVFEPFFSTKDVGEGTGLGLSVSWGIVREHGGWIAVDTTLGQGSAFTVYLPVQGGPARPSALLLEPANVTVTKTQPVRLTGTGRALSSPPYAPLDSALVQERNDA